MRAWFLVAALTAACVDAAKKSSKSGMADLLDLTDDTLEAALAKHPIMLISITVPNCDICNQVGRRLGSAVAELRVQAKNAVALGQLRITSNDSPVLAQIVQGQLTLPKLIVFREGEALDYQGDITKESIVSEMLREASRDTVQTFKSVKQAERFLHLDSWSAQHADEEKPPRVVGFFPSNNSAAYGVYRETARKLQGLIAFGECFDVAIQRKFLGKPARKSTIQLVKADKKERKLTYAGPLMVTKLARWVATHSVSLVQDLSTESSIESHMALGVPLFLLLMPDSYEEELGEMMQHLRAVASRVRERLLFGYGFKDTEPWPQFAAQLGIDRSATGAFWMIVGNNMDVTGRNWSMAWLRPPSLGFQIYAMEARGKESAADVTEKKVEKFISNFLKQVDDMTPEEDLSKAVVEEEEEATDEATAAAAQPAAATSAEAVNYDKQLRKRIGELQMNFNSGVANIKKVLDDVQDAPSLLKGKAASLTSIVQNMELKLKKDVLGLKRELMELGRSDKTEL
mmetsp:Transcript_46178/g.76352  ORF Transcript_46178/g.76352 Transcript_46178/m.76352 type:complete len:515 (-) Transcript_46178:82-1626(-)